MTDLDRAEIRAELIHEIACLKTGGGFPPWYSCRADAIRYMENALRNFDAYVEAD